MNLAERIEDTILLEHTDTIHKREDVTEIAISIIAEQPFMNRNITEDDIRRHINRYFGKVV